MDLRVAPAHSGEEDDQDDGEYDTSVAKQKVSVTLSPERIERARAVTGRANLSELLDDALDAIVERELERQWLAAHDRAAAAAVDLPGEIVVDLTDVPWDDR